MKLIRTKGRGAQQTAEILAASNSAGGAALDAVLPPSNALWPMCAGGRPRSAALHSSIRWPHRRGRSRVTTEEMASAWDAAHPRCARLCPRLPSKFAALRGQLPASWSENSVPALHRQLVRPSARWAAMCPAAVILCLHAADDRHPAQVAVSGASPLFPPSPRRRPRAAHLIGITEFYRLGGAHAVAALAYGIAGAVRIAKVDKIVGPGNLYVTAAKRLVAFDCAIDLLAAHGDCGHQRAWQCERDRLDLVAQAEHDPRRWPFSSPRHDLAKDVMAKQNCAAA